MHSHQGLLTRSVNAKELVQGEYFLSTGRHRLRVNVRGFCCLIFLASWVEFKFFANSLFISFNCVVPFSPVSSYQLKYASNWLCGDPIL